MMKSLILLSLLPLASLAGEIIRIETKTADVDDAGMTLAGSISIELLMTDSTFCRINNLQADGITFSRGKIDTFVNETLQNCQGFVAPGSTLPRLSLYHQGLDSWLPQYVAVFFNDGKYAYCPDGEFIDNRQIHDLECGGLRDYDMEDKFEEWGWDSQT